jgi:NitT/TauT family transport system substrate-binding protein
MSETALRRMDLVLDWVPNVQFAGPCLALTRGLYRDAGIEMALVPWQEDGRGIVEKTCARSGLALGSSEDNLVIDAASRGEARIAAVAAMFQTTPLVLMSRPESPVTTVAGLRGRRVAIHCDGLHVLESLLELHGIARDEVEIVEVANDLGNLTSRRFDAVQGYAVCEPLEHAARGVRPATLTLRHAALHPYAQVMFAPEESLAAEPELYRAALDATFAGWRAAMADPAAALDAIAQVGAPMGDAAFEREALAQAAALVRGEGEDGRGGLGRIDPARWAANVRAYIASGLVPPGTPPDCGLRTDIWPGARAVRAGAAS